MAFATLENAMVHTKVEMSGLLRQMVEEVMGRLREMSLLEWIYYLMPEYSLKVLVAQLCLTLCDPMNCSPPGSSVHLIFQARISISWLISVEGSSEHSFIQAVRNVFMRWAWEVLATPEKFRGVSPLELGLAARDAVTELGSLVITKMVGSSNNRGHVVTLNTRSKAGTVTGKSSKVKVARGGSSLQRILETLNRTWCFCKSTILQLKKEYGVL